MPRLVLTAAALVAIVAAQPSAGPAAAQATERCYGVSKAGQNDGIGDAESAGSATVDFQGDAWTWTPAGTCLTLPLPARPDGTPRRGSYRPLDRDAP
jgi:uncharacterized membrane protein